MQDRNDMSKESAAGIAAYAGLDLLVFVAVIWRRRLLMLLIVSAFSAVGVAYALLAPKWYQATTVLLQVEGGSGMFGSSQLNGLASLAGIALPTGGSSQEPLAVLKSRELVRSAILDMNLLPVLFSSKWDAAKSDWKLNVKDHAPDLRDGVEFFVRDVRSVGEDRKTGLITLSISWKDPAIAAEWANTLVLKANSLLRERARADAEANIRYLREEIAVANVPSLQQAIGKVLESEMQKLLLARGRTDYAFRQIDIAVAPKEWLRPKLPLVIAAAVVAGLLTGFVVVFLLHLRELKRLSSPSRI